MVDVQSLRVSEVRDLLRLMAQLGRLSMMTAVWRTTLIKGLAHISNMYVVGIFYIQEQEKTNARRDMKLLEVCWAKPPDVPISAEFPSPLKRHRAVREVQKRSGPGRPCFVPPWTVSPGAGSAETSDGASGNSRHPVIELTFHDTLPPPLSRASVTYLLYSEQASGRCTEPEALVTLFHRELQNLSGRHTDENENQEIQELLPERQRQILDRLLAGDGEKQIARKLGLSIHTVHSYIRRLYRRLNVSNRSQLFRAYYAREKTTKFPAACPLTSRTRMKP